MKAFSVAMRARVAFITVALTAVLAPAAFAAQPATNVYFDIGSYPAGAFSFPNQTPGTDTGYYTGSWWIDGVQTSQRVEQVRGGALVTGSPTAPTTVQPGDVFRVVRNSDGTVLAQTTFDGRPALGDRACIGQNGFDGTRGPDATVAVRRIGSFELMQFRYGPGYGRDAWNGRVRSLGDGTFAGVFDDPIARGDLLEVTQTIATRTPDTLTTLNTTTWRFAAACPPPVAPVPDTTPPKLVSFDLGAPQTSLASFLKYGLATFIGVDEPSTITQALYLDNGAKLPASAAKKKKKVKKATLLASGRTTSTVPGVVKVVLKPTRQGKALLRRARSAKAVLRTSIKDASGNVTNLKPRKLKFKRG